MDRSTASAVASSTFIGPIAIELRLDALVARVDDVLKVDLDRDRRRDREDVVEQLHAEQPALWKAWTTAPAERVSRAGQTESLGRPGGGRESVLKLSVGLKKSLPL